MKIGFVSLGCCKNLVDSEQIMGMIKRGGHEIVANPKDAQAIIVNTCGFIESAKEESINTIFKMAQYKERNLEKLIVCGCLAQRYTDTLREEIPEIDAVIPIREYNTLASQLQKILGSDTLLDKAERVISGNPWQAYVKISDGCSNRCAYCAIPLIRGDQKSRTIEDIMEEVNHLASIGVKELTLIAQDTTKYGLDNYGELMLPELLRQVSKVEGLHWIRVLYMYPDEIVDDVLQAMSESEKIVPYFDIPMQHANNRLLKLMNRRGPKEDVLKVVDKIHTMFPNATLRTTMIVGFPTETEEEFEATKVFLEKVHFYEMHIFKYSRRKGTVADKMKEQVADTVKSERSAVLLALEKAQSLEYRKMYIGKRLEVLIEELTEIDGRSYYTGYTKNYIRVAIAADEFKDNPVNDIYECMADKLICDGVTILARYN